MVEIAHLSGFLFRDPVPTMGKGQYYTEALNIFREIKDRVEEGVTLNNLGAVYSTLGNLKEALRCYEEALNIFKEIGDQWEEGRALHNVGVVYSDLGAKEQALKYYEEALRIRWEIKDLGGEGKTLLSIGGALLCTGALRCCSCQLPTCSANI